MKRQLLTSKTVRLPWKYYSSKDGVRVESRMFMVADYIYQQTDRKFNLPINQFVDHNFWKVITAEDMNLLHMNRFFIELCDLFAAGSVQ